MIILCLQGAYVTPLLKYSFPTKINLNLIKPRDLIANLEEVQRMEKQ